MNIIIVCLLMVIGVSSPVWAEDTSQYKNLIQIPLTDGTVSLDIVQEVTRAQNVKTSGIVLLGVGAGMALLGGIGLLVTNVYKEQGNAVPIGLEEVSVPLLSFSMPFVMGGSIMWGRSNISLDKYSTMMNIIRNRSMANDTPEKPVMSMATFQKKSTTAKILQICGMTIASLGVGLYGVWGVDSAMGGVLPNDILMPMVISGALGGIAGGVLWGFGEKEKIDLYNKLLL